jgi:DNA primase
MEITEIKSKLTLAMVLHYYSLKPDKNLRLNCPFHEDKTPSMQVYYKTHTAYCFSSNCKTHGKSLDVIDFILHKENITKHEAIKKAETMTTGGSTITGNTGAISREQFLQKMFTYFKNAVHNSPQAKQYIQSRALDYTKLEIGYNAAQFHHGTRKDEQLINDCVKYGLLIDAGLTSKTGDKAYKVFGKGCIVFALKNKANQVTGLYFRSTVNETESKHFYLKDRKGIYPNYPNPTTKKLILTESIIDCASLLQIDEINKNYSLISCYGTNGLNEEIKKAILEWAEATPSPSGRAGLGKEIIFVFDSDEAGKTAVEKYSKELNELLPSVVISSVTVPLKDINETAQAHEDETIFTQLINERQFIFSSGEPPQAIIFSTETDKGGSQTPIKKNKTSEQKENTTSETTVKPIPSEQGILNTSNPDQLIYETAEINITVWGGIEIENLSRLKVSLHIQLKANKYRSFRDDVNLYSHSSTQKLIRSIAETLELSTTIVSSTTADFIEALEKYRLAQREQQLKALVPQAYIMTEQEKQAAQNYLTENDLVKRTLETLSK